VFIGLLALPGSGQCVSLLMRQKKKADNMGMMFGGYGRGKTIKKRGKNCPTVQTTSTPLRKKENSAGTGL
jgi:hypothetical protein